MEPVSFAVLDALHLFVCNTLCFRWCVLACPEYPWARFALQWLNAGSGK